jgi:type I restriction enzyme, S subunit
MSSEWGTKRLGDCCEKIGSGATPKGGKDAYLDFGPVYLIRSQNVHNDGFSPSGLAFISEEQAQKLDNVKVESGDVLLNITGDSVARVCQAPHYFLPARVNQHVAIIRPTPSVFDARYLRYFLASPAQQDFMLGLAAAGATRNALTKGMIESFEVPCPSLPVQQGIADVLASLDDRITLLRETNTTLEAIAQALFKSWFVDFDPVHAKMQGRAPEGMDETTAALFPDSFEESELEVVPTGWSVGSVGDFARLKKGTVNPGSQPDTVFEHFSLPAFDDGQSPVIESGASIKSNKTPVPEDAVLLSKLNPHIPRIWLPVSVGPNAVCSTEFLVFQPTGVGSKELIYCLFSSLDFISRLQQLVTGTSNSHQRIKPDQVALMTSVVPTASIASAFEILMRPVFDRVYANRQKVQTLSRIRDSLLPRLISGQLCLPEIILI